MSHGIANVPEPFNEPIRQYGPGSSHKKSLKARLSELIADPAEIPVVVGGREIRTGRVGSISAPHDHECHLATYHEAGPDEIEAAVEAAGDAWHEWSEMPWEARVGVFLRAADLLAGPWRDTINAATMLGQSKTAFQAEIDAACELADFWRFNSSYLRAILEGQPESPAGQWNRSEFRALEGFVFAVTPFNFTSIAGNLPTAPALMGNTVLWKPATSSLLSSWYLFQLLHEAGLPDGVINFLPGEGPDIGPLVLPLPQLAGIHFTGSTATFQTMWRTVGESISGYRSYPRIVGETGGKDFIFAHPSADARALSVAIVRGAFEYQGQKCSAASRAYIPESLWPSVREQVAAEVAALSQGSPLDFRNFMSAVIDRRAFEKISGAIDKAVGSGSYEVIAGGGHDDSEGWFIEPTVMRSDDPRGFLMCDELFGPVISIYVYPDSQVAETAKVCDTTSPYALTGAIFARDRGAIVDLSKRLRHSAGNFYINDKPTGAVVGQQPFGGGRASGTNDKAGSPLNLLRWTSQRAIKETLVSPTEVAYPHMGEE